VLSRALRLRREALTELTPGELTSVAGAVRTAQTEDVKRCLTAVSQGETCIRCITRELCNA
jgi:hypothetical protein